MKEGLTMKNKKIIIIIICILLFLVILYLLMPLNDIKLINATISINEVPEIIVEETQEIYSSNRVIYEFTIKNNGRNDIGDIASPINIYIIPSEDLSNFVGDSMFFDNENRNGMIPLSISSMDEVRYIVEYRLDDIKVYDVDDIESYIDKFTEITLLLKVNTREILNEKLNKNLFTIK